MGTQNRRDDFLIIKACSLVFQMSRGGTEEDWCAASYLSLPLPPPLSLSLRVTGTWSSGEYLNNMQMRAARDAGEERGETAATPAAMRGSGVEPRRGPGRGSVCGGRKAVIATHAYAWLSSNYGSLALVSITANGQGSG